MMKGTSNSNKVTVVDKEFKRLRVKSNIRSIMS